MILVEGRVLDDIRIAAPCPASWARMRGDRRKRFCTLCRRHVYNLSAMTRTEAEAFVRGSDGRRCARFFRRIDGTVITSDCAVGLRLEAKAKFRHALTIALLLAANVFAALWCALKTPRPVITVTEEEPTTTTTVQVMGGM